MTDPVPCGARLPPNARVDIGPQRYPRMHRRHNLGVVLSAGPTLPGPDTPVCEPLLVNFTPHNKMLQRDGGVARLRALDNRIGPSGRWHFTGQTIVIDPAYPAFLAVGAECAAGG